MLKKTSLILLFLFSISLLHADSYLRLMHITSGNGLSQNTVNAIFKDSRGFVWFGTNDGLNRYDGKTFKIFRQSHNGSNSIGANGITAITEDSESHLWIGTKQNGISIYFPETDSFAILNHRVSDPESVAANYVTEISFIKPNLIFVGFNNGKFDIVNIETFEIKHGSLPEKRYRSGSVGEMSFVKDSLGNIWIGSAKSGLYLYDPVTGSVKEVPLYAIHNKLNGTKKEPVRITDIKVFDKSRLLMATSRTGMIMFNILNHSYKQYYLSEDVGFNSGNYNILNSFEILNDSILWITTMDAGLIEYNIRTKKSTYYNSHYSNNNFDYDGLKKIYKDDQGIVWIGSNGMGLYYYNPQASLFITVSMKSTDEPNLTFNSVRTLYKTGHKLYVGGYVGFNVIDLDNKSCTKILNNNVPYYITELPGDPGFIWVAMEGGTDNLIRLNKTTHAIEHIYPFSRLTPDDWMPCFKVLPYGDSLMWIGSVNGNLLLYNYKSKKKVKLFSHKTNPDFINGNILALYLRKKNRLWVGSATDGIVVMNPETGKIIHRFTNKTSGTSRYFVNTVKTIVEDHNGNLWVGTGNGLYRYVDSITSFKGYYTTDGLPNNTVYGILEDKKGNLWLSTNKGLSVFNPETELFVNFDSKYGLQEDEFNTNAYFKDSTGFFCFGGIKGLTYFYPDKFNLDTINTKVQITGVAVNNVPVKISLLNTASPLEISAKAHSISIDFAGLDYINPFNIRYRYKINGGAWIPIGNNNNITLMFSGYGINTLIINASNTSGHWSKYKTKLLFNVKSPFYLRWWFIVIVIVIVVFLGTSFFYYRTFLLRRRQRLLEDEISMATNHLKKTQLRLEKEIAHKEVVEKELRESNATKNKIFSIIGHDLLNPFNALLGFSELLKENIDVASKDDLKSYANVMYHSSHSLFNMVQNILTWSRAQQKKIVPFPEDLKVFEVVQLVYNAQSQHASSKGIRLLNSVPEHIMVVFDRNMLEIIIRNLVSNAIKFSNKGTTVEISARCYHGKVTLEIKDQGIGMGKTKLDNLFNSGKNIKTKGTNDEKGTGLGLLLVKEFLKQNGASIHVESEEGKGTKFILVLKAGKC